MKRILIPLSCHGGDPSEIAIPSLLLLKSGVEVVFATPDGKPAVADQYMLTGKRLGILKSILAARKDAVEAYNELQNHVAFKNPMTYQQVKSANFDGIYIPGGHDKTIKPYLESTLLQQTISEFFDQNKLVAAVCHGVVLVARSINKDTGKSVIYDYKTTSLLKKQERLAYQLTRLWLGDYYLTYPENTVEDEVTNALAHPKHFIPGSLPLFRDSKNNLSGGFIVQDRNYLSARWPGDIYNLSFAMINKLTKLDVS